MPGKGFRWELIALSAVLTLAVLSLAYFSYESMGVRKPLEKALLADPDVGAVKILKDRDTEVVQITLSKVPDLSVTYTRLHTLVKGRMGQAPFRLEVKDARNADLQDVYHSIHYYLEEASVRGNFGTMIEACSSILSKAGISDYKITVDQNHIYVQIGSGANFLYQVLDRPAEASTGGVTQ